MYQLKSKTDSVATPTCIWDWLHDEFGLDIHDPCPLCEYDPAVHTNGLTSDWGSVNYVNPPCSKGYQWVKKAREEWLKGKTCIVLMKTNITNCKYFAECSAGAELVFISHKVTFEGYHSPAWFPLMFVVYHAGKTMNSFRCVNLLKNFLDAVGHGQGTTD